MKQILWFLLCSLTGHRMYQKYMGDAPVYMLQKCARCSYETKKVPVGSRGIYTGGPYVGLITPAHTDHELQGAK